MRVLSAPSYSVGLWAPHLPRPHGQPSGCPSPAVGGGGQQGKSCLVSSYWFSFSSSICEVVHLMPPWDSRFSKREFKMFCVIASGSQPFSAVFLKLFRLFSCCCFQEFHFNKIPTVLTIWVKARQQCYLLPAVSAWGHSFLNNCDCKFQCCQQGWSQVCISKI